VVEKKTAESRIFRKKKQLRAEYLSACSRSIFSLPSGSACASFDRNFSHHGAMVTALLFSRWKCATAALLCPWKGCARLLDDNTVQISSRCFSACVWSELSDDVAHGTVKISRFLGTYAGVVKSALFFKEKIQVQTPKDYPFEIKAIFVVPEKPRVFTASSSCEPPGQLELRLPVRRSN